MTERVLQALRRRTNHRELVIVREIVLLEETRAPANDLRIALDRLVRDRVIEILSPLPFLVLRWSGSRPDRVQEKQPGSKQDRASVIEVRVSSPAATKQQQHEDGGAGEGGLLLDEVITVLGPGADRDEFREILSGVPPALIHRCLKRVEATKQIRVSRAALFRSLLSKLSA